MPYKKPYYRRKRKKHWGYTNYNKGLTLGAKALGIALATKRLLNVEFKSIDNVLNVQPITTTGLTLNLATIGQGTGESEREGNQIKVTSVYLDYFISINASATDTTIRIMIFVDKQPNGASTTLTELLSDPTSPANIVSPINLGNKYRINMLYNKRHQLSINGRRNAQGKRYIKQQLKVRYSGSGSTISALTTNNIRFIAISDEATNTPTIECSMRTRFIDN